NPSNRNGGLADSELVSIPLVLTMYASLTEFVPVNVSVAGSKPPRLIRFAETLPGPTEFWTAQPVLGVRRTRPLVADQVGAPFASSIGLLLESRAASASMSTCCPTEM